MAASRAGVHLVSRADMARRLGVARPTVTKACKPGGRLARACKGMQVNCLHPDAKRWIAQREAVRAAAEAEADAAIPVDGDDAPEGDDDDAPAPAQILMPWQAAVDLAELEQPLTELTERYGSAEAFANWVKSRKMLEEARKAEMLRERVAGRLIARTTVLRMVDNIDSAFRLLLSDAPRTIATRLGCADLTAASALIRDVLSQQLEAAQSHMIAALDADDPMAPLMEAAE
jgi:hypothetical protein